MNKPSIPKGTRDFSPLEMARRNYIFDTIKAVYRLHGYQQIETPAMEQLSTLMGKYGQEGDKLLFKVLNSGDYLKTLPSEVLQERELAKITQEISEKGLRYDLTVPLARYVVMHRNEIALPFKRYQIQPVWRADKPQKGRYREFYQCDADVLGSDSLLNEVELISILDQVFSRLGLRVHILLNNRKILAAIAEYLGAADKLVDITVAIDKLDKIGLDKVWSELEAKGFTKEQLDKLRPILALAGTNEEKLQQLEQILSDSQEGLTGIKELREILSYLGAYQLQNTIEIDLSLARGLSYYTGAILEVKVKDVAIGSISGGGRYDNLTGIFSNERITGVGISFGADRIYDALLELNLFPAALDSETDILFANFGELETKYSLPLIARLRTQGISVELYPDAAKMKKQLSYANSRRIRYVAMVGESEMAEGKIKIKDMESGEQLDLDEAQVISLVAKK